jgi:nitronate monooxygenase
MQFNQDFCKQFDIKYPIFQAGMGKTMGSPTTPELVYEVSNAGGVGFLGATGLTLDEIDQAVKKIRENTDKPFGVGTLLPRDVAADSETREEIRNVIKNEYPEHLKFIKNLCEEYKISLVNLPAKETVSRRAAEEQIDLIVDLEVPFISMGLGDISHLVSKVKNSDTKTLGLVGNVKTAKIHDDAGVDIIVAQGYEAGGHTGNIANFALLPQVVDAVTAPVLGAGGIADGRGIAAAISLGCVGVWMGTAFLFATETDIYPEHQKQLVEGSTEDFVISRTYTGKPSRIYRTEILERWKDSNLTTLPMPLQFVLFDDFVWSAESSKKYELMNNPAGQISGMVKEVKPAKNIVIELVEGFEVI